MSENQNMTLTAVLDFKDRLSAKIKSVNSSLNGVRSSTERVDMSVKGIQQSMATAGKSALSMSKDVDKARASLEGVRGSYRATVGLNDNASSKVRQVREGLESFRGKVYTATVNIKQNGMEKLNGLKNSMSSMASGAMMGLPMQMAGAAGIGLGIYDAVKSYMDFEQEMGNVAAISGATGAAFDALTAKAQQMGASTMFTAKQSAEAFKYMAMAGWSTEQMLGGIDGVMNLAAASGEDLGRVSDIVTDALTAFGLQANQAGHFADVLAKASSKSNTNVSMMGMTFKYVAPLAGALKYSVEDVATSIGLMANAGIKGEQAGTSLRAIMTRLTTPPKQAGAAMDQLGIKMQHADGSMKSWMETMVDLRKAFAGLGDADKAKFASMIAGQEAMSGFLAMVNASDDDFQKLTSEIRNADGAAKEMADRRMDNLAGDLTYLSSAWDGLTQKIMKSSGAAGGLRSVVQGVKGLMENFTTAMDKGFGFAVFDTAIKAVKQLKDSFIQLDGVGSILSGGILAAGIYKIITLSKKAYDSVKALSTSASSMGAPKVGGGLATTAGQAMGSMTISAGTVIVNGKSVAGGAGSAAGGGVDIGTTAEGGKGKAPKGKAPAGAAGRLSSASKLAGRLAIPLALASGAIDAYSISSENDKSLSEAQAQVENAGTTEEKDAALANLEQVKGDNTNRMGASLGSTGGAIAGGIAGAKAGAVGGAAIGSLFGGVGAAPGAAIGGVVGGIGGAIAGSALGEAIGGQVTQIKQAFAGAWEYVKAGANNNIEYVSNKFGELATAAGNAWGGVKDAASNEWNYITGITGNVVQGVEAKWDDFKGWGAEAFAPIKNGFINVANFMVGLAAITVGAIGGALEPVVTYINDNIWTPITETAGAAWDTVTATAAEKWDGMMATFSEAAAWFDTSVWQPITETASTAWGNISALPGMAAEWAMSSWTEVTGWFDATVWQPLSMAASSAWDMVTSAAGNAWTGITSFFAPAAAWFDGTVWQPISTAADGVKSAIVNAFQSAWNAVTSLWSAAGSWFEANVIGPIREKFNSIASIGASITGWGGGGDGPHHASGTSWAPGGFTEVNEHGGEIIDLPNGSRVYPHATTVKMLNEQMKKSMPTAQAYAGVNNLDSMANTTGFMDGAPAGDAASVASAEMNLPTQGDQIGDIIGRLKDMLPAQQQEKKEAGNVTITGNTFEVREEADIDKIAYKLYDLMAGAQANYNVT